MFRTGVVTAAIALVLMSVSGISAGETEQDIVNRYLKKAKEKHTNKTSWLAVNFSLNRINRENDYNRFAIYSSDHFTNTSLPWLDNAKAFGIDLGVIFGKKFAWSIGGEYWLKLGTNQSGSFDYNPPGGTPTQVTDLTSEIQVFGVTSSLQYYVYNPPTPQKPLTNLSVRVGGSVGYYQATWDIWDEYQNLNLATSSPAGENTSYKGTAPGLTFGLGIDYPLQVFNLALAVDFSYLYLNFTNVAWYNSQSQEIVATYDGTSDGRVDLGLSGFRGKVEIKRFFQW